jgi:hypothetical protein
MPRSGLKKTGFAVGVVITLIIDLDRPQTGFMTVSQQPLLDLIERMK